MEVPRRRPDVLVLHRRQRRDEVVRHRVDGPAGRRRAQGRDVGGLRRLRPGRPLPRRRHRPPSAARLRHRRPHQGQRHVRPRRLPARLHGSRDNHFRVIAVDRAAPEELWRLSANDVSPVLWNNDWDGSGLVHDGYLYEGGENSQFHVVELNRSYAGDGKVAVDPELAFNAPGWDSELLSAAPRQERLHRELRRHVRRASSTSPTRAAWCRAGTSPRWPRASPPSGSSATGWATTWTPRSSSTTRGCSTSPPSGSATCPGGARSASW